ncbi:cytochrome c-type biogenesis protein CcmH/NrfF [Marmoricola sp. OAE513]|uniref:hypothetical protein n=1 Tax=Marmoricola sp. OAE513 TaxID=2817894 RepID=UPI001AE257C7
MEILLWLVPAAVTTGLATLYVSWIGRERTEREPTEADHERFAAAITKPLPPRVQRTEQTRRAS